MHHCTGNCQQGRKPCDCPLDADHGEYTSPTVKAIEDGLMVVIVLIALFGLAVILFDHGGYL